MILTRAHVSASNLPAGDQVFNLVKFFGHTKYHLENPKPLGEVYYIFLCSKAPRFCSNFVSPIVLLSAYTLF
jgi:hypothetical protein